MHMCIYTYICICDHMCIHIYICMYVVMRKMVINRRDFMGYPILRHPFITRNA